MSTLINSSNKCLVSALDTERGKNKFYQEALAETLSLIKAHKYSMTKNALMDSGDFSSSQIYRALSTAKYERGYDTYNNENKKWSFSFCETTDEGENLRITVCPSSSCAKVINVNFLKKNSSHEQMQEKNEIERDQVLNFISQGRYTYSIHANQRMIKRNLTTSMIDNVVLYGAHDVTRDKWDSARKTWSFSFCDIIDGRKIRACVVTGKLSAKITTVIDATPGIDSCSDNIDDPSRRKSINQEEGEAFEDRFQANTGETESISRSEARHGKKRKSISSSYAKHHEHAVSKRK